MKVRLYLYVCVCQCEHACVGLSVVWHTGMHTCVFVCVHVPQDP